MSKLSEFIKSNGTLVGIIAPVFWSLTAVFSNVIINIPSFELLCTSFLFCFLYIIIFNKKPVPFTKIPWKLSVASFIGISLNPICYFSAFKLAPSAKVDLINYLWPVLLLFVTAFLPTEKVKQRHIIACGIAFVGIVILLENTTQNVLLCKNHIIGYFLALSSAITWVIFSITLKFYKFKMKDLMPYFCLVGLAITLFFHIQFETFYMPSLVELSILIIMGAGCMGFAYKCWDYGIKYGSLPILSIASYCIPVVSIILLVVFGYTTLSTRLAIATILVSLAGYLAFTKYFDKQVKFKWKIFNFNLSFSNSKNF